METENYQNQTGPAQNGSPQPAPAAAQTSLGLQQNVACLLAYLFGVIGGLVDRPVIAVPTSVSGSMPRSRSFRALPRISY